MKGDTRTRVSSVPDGFSCDESGDDPKFSCIKCGVPTVKAKA